MNETPPMPPEPPATAQKAGIPALGWLGIGCGTVVVIAVLVISLLIGWCKRTVGDLTEFQRNPEKAAAELMVRMNSNVEKIADNEAAGEMTLRTKDGKEMTLSYKEISEGRFMMPDGEAQTMTPGKIDLADVPAWVPRVPGLKTVASSMRNEMGGKASGLYSTTTTEAIDSLEFFFKAEAEKLDFTSSSNASFKSNGVENRSFSYSGGGRKLDIIITVNPGEDTQVNVGYEERE